MEKNIVAGEFDPKKQLNSIDEILDIDRIAFEIANGNETVDQNYINEITILKTYVEKDPCIPDRYNIYDTPSSGRGGGGGGGGGDCCSTLCGAICICGGCQMLCGWLAYDDGCSKILDCIGCLFKI